MGLFEDIEALIKRPSKDALGDFWHKSPTHKISIAVPAVLVAFEGTAWASHELNPLGLIDELVRRLSLSAEVATEAKRIFKLAEKKHRLALKSLLARTSIYYAANQISAGSISFEDVAEGLLTPLWISQTYKNKFVKQFGPIKLRTQSGSGDLVEDMMLKAKLPMDLRGDVESLIASSHGTLRHFDLEMRVMAAVYCFALIYNPTFIPRDLTDGTRWTEPMLRSAYWKLSKKRLLNRSHKAFKVR